MTHKDKLEIAVAQREELLIEIEALRVSGGLRIAGRNLDRLAERCRKTDTYEVNGLSKSFWEIPT